VKSFIPLILLFSLFSCIKKDKTHIKSTLLKSSFLKGYVLSKDSILSPDIIPINDINLKKIKLGNPIRVQTNTNIHIAGQPKINKIGKPKIILLGKDTFQIPKKITATNLEIDAGLPEVVIAKDAYTKDQNSQNFSSFSKLQGLTHSNITFLYEDNLGNIWLGTGGGGVTKYDGNSFTHFTEREGLTDNFITCIIQDNSGNLFFGTENGGVSKYDGRTFNNYTKKEGMASDFVTCMIKDKSGDLWFGTKSEGISKFNGKTFTHFTKKEGLVDNSVTCILEDTSGSIWIGTKQGGISVFNGYSFKTFSIREGLTSDFITSLIQDKDGNIWLGTNNDGLSKFDGVNLTHFTTQEGLSSNNVTSILQDDLGNIWIGTNGGGASKFNNKTFTHYTEKEGLNNSIIRHIIQDKNGILWFGKGGGGVSKYDYRSFNFFTDQEGLSNSTILSIVQDLYGNMWFGTEGGGVSYYDGHSFVHYTTKDGLSDNIVYSIAQDKLGNMWFGTTSGITKFDGKTFTQFLNIDGLSDYTIYSIILDNNGYLWFASQGGGAFKYDGNSFIRYTTKQGLSSDVIRTIYQDNLKNIWFGTYGGGITKFEFSDSKNNILNKVIHFTEKQGMPDNFIRSIVQDKFGNFWLGGLGFKGLTFFNEKSFTSFTDKEGLSNNVVCSILEDKSGNIWSGNRFGLSKLSTDKLTLINDKIKNGKNIQSENLFESFTYDDGFLGVGCNSNSIFLSKDRTLWIGANDRLTVYKANLTSNYIDTLAPIIQLSSIELFNENIPWFNLLNRKDSSIVLANGVLINDVEFDNISNWFGLPQELSLAHDNNYLTFNFIGITTFRPKKVKYQYILDGLDDNWSTITNKTFATYGNLPPGDYTFKVKAMNCNQIWSQPFQYKFTIRPPWWKTWWFRSLLFTSVVASIMVYIKWRERKLQKANIVLEKTVRERTIELVQKNNIVKEQKKIVEEKHKEITDSINYAERIQRSFLATKQHLDEYLNKTVISSEVEKSTVITENYFIFFKPKDVVSGDFYWSATLNNGNFILATADSTGHGVPGAIMSLLNITSLEKAIETHHEPSQILNATRKIIIERLIRDGSPEGGKDGMDCSLCVYDFNTMQLHMALANNPVWIVRPCHPEHSEGSEKSDASFVSMTNYKVIEIKPDKMPVGKHDRQDTPFTTQSIQLQKGDVIYTLTDGFPDQFGGEKGKKFMGKNLRELLSQNAHLPMHEQKQLLENIFNNWRGNLEQVDDVTVIGVRV
jgi:ligand-binding sensor domain-containing protein/serine phosphatase RsbU (regulator of sigma subunit)